MKVKKLVLGLCLAAVPFVTTAATDVVQEGFKQAQTSIEAQSDDKVRAIRTIVDEAENQLQATFDELKKHKKKFGKDWNNIEEGFVYYSRTEADYINTLLDGHIQICRALGVTEKCNELATNAVVRSAEAMLARAKLVNEVALNRNVPKFDLKLTEDIEGPINKALRKAITDNDAKIQLIETSRYFLRLKMTYLGLLEQLALSNKAKYRAAMVEHEMVAQDRLRGRELADLWAATGKEAIAPRPVGEKRRAAMLHEFDIE
jgi:hypothetical protein